MFGISSRLASDFGRSQYLGWLEFPARLRSRFLENLVMWADIPQDE
jgi:hypothetical protein